MLPDAYGCVVANRFGNLLDDEADPFDLINEVETEKEKKKKKKKKDDDKKGKQKKPGQRESQKDRRLPIASDGQEPVPGGRHTLGCIVVTHPESKRFWQLLVFLDCIVQPSGRFA
uniref:Intracellular hyaluronan-binding protein 4 N-terminal domain-containing protein n=1 Tax=Seriola lalandi dorsalis TaxID=1841481 RepID=A0A3B4YP92_SERLL